MAAIELKMSLLQEVISLEGEELIKKALSNVCHIKVTAFGKATPIEKLTNDYVEPTREETLVRLRNALQDMRDLHEGRDVEHKFKDLSELLDEI